MPSQIKRNLKDLGFSEHEAAVYLSLTELGEAPASKIAKKADLPRTTVISILEKLNLDGYLTIHRYRGLNYYWIESPDVIGEFFRNKAALAEGLGAALRKMYRAGANFPFVKVYDTKTNIGKFVIKIMSSLKKKSAVYTIDTPREGSYRKIFSAESEKLFFRLKEKKQIVTHTLIPHGSYREIPDNKITAQNIKIRELPVGIDFSSSLWLAGERVILFSGNPPFIVQISHASIYAGIKAVYDFLWRISEPKN